ncbi:hypothetical protein BASA83_007538 [Batrachochytrium salamandrivorans]|nr:hypothetical protein BASA83_007538 [Batrachochytrium salamandrivorans]
MEKLVADLSARIKSLEKESIILQKEAQESRAIANLPYWNVPLLPIHLQLRENPKSSSQTNSTDLAVTFEVSSISSNSFSGFNHSLTAPSN